MKRSITFGLLASLVLLPVLHAAETRVWTSRKGLTLEAELLKFDETNVTVLSKERKEIVIPLVDLSIADRQHLVEERQADPKILIVGEVGEPETQVKIDSKTFKKIKDSNLTFGTDSDSDYELLETEHFIIASAGDVRPHAMAETAERMWHGMAFQHMNFRKDWGDHKMMVMVVEKRAVYTALGKWYVTQLKDAGKDEDASKVNALWEKVGGTSINLPADMVEKYKAFELVPVFNVKDNSQFFKKAMGPFMVHCMAGTLLDHQMGNVSSYGVKGLFAVTKGHSYYKEISLTGKCETSLISASGSDNDMIKENRGFEDGKDWAKTLKPLVKKGEMKLHMETVFGWNSESLKPEQLAVMYSLSSYMQSTPLRLTGFATMVKRIESSKQIPEPVEIAKLFGFETVEAFETDWKNYVISSAFK